MLTICTKAKLGRNTEELVTQACEVYTVNKTANIQKIPTPFKIIKTQGKFLIAVPEQKSTVDYLGEYEGIPFAMEVKETSNKTSYPFDPWKREQHQRDFLSRWKGFKYYLIGFSKLGEYYLVDFNTYENLYVKSTLGGKKSINISWFRENASQISFKRGFLDFLGAVDKAKIA